MKSVPFLYLSVTVFTVCLLVTGCGSPEPDHVQETVQDTLHYLAAYDSIGVEMGDSTLMLGNVWSSGYTPDGRIFILDRAIGGIRFYTSQGCYLSSFIPAGEGPGEFNSLDRAVMDAEGNLYLGSFYDRKLALYDFQLNFIREIRFENGMRGGPGRIACGADSGFIISSMIMDTEQELYINQCALFTDSEEPDIVYMQRSAPISEEMNYDRTTAMRHASGPDGRVYVAAPERYEIFCFSTEGDSLFSFGRSDFVSEAKPDSLIDEIRERARQQFMNFYGTDEGFSYEPAHFWDPVRSISFDSENRIWIRGEHYTRQADIFSPDGNFLYTVEFQAPEWQDCQGWNIRITPGGVLADPRNPEIYPVVYMLREEPAIR